MKNTQTVQKSFKVWAGVFALVLAFAIAFIYDGFAIRSYADNQGKVTASSAKVRASAPSGEVLGQVAKDTTINISGEITASDGYVWYQTTLNGKTGYVRSDLVKKLDDASAGGSTASGINTDGVSKVNPVSATVDGSDSVRIRNQASTSGAIVTTAARGVALTVNGTTQGSDGKTWYLISYNSNGTNVEGFIRSDYVKLSGELTPYNEQPVQQEPAEPAPEPDEPVQESKPVVVKPYDTLEQGGEWLLVDSDGNGWSIQELFDKVKNNAEAYEKAHKQANTLKIVAIILGVLMVAAAAVAVALFLKMKDMADSAYYREVEKETMRRRGEQPKQKVMQTVGEEKKPANGQGQPVRRPANGQQGQPVRRPANAEGQPVRRPANAEGQPVRRPVNAEGQPVRRPVNAEGQPVRRPVNAEGQPVRRPVNAEGQPVRRPMNAEGQPVKRPAPQQVKPQPQPAQKPDGGDGDDDFSFEFLSDFDE